MDGNTQNESEVWLNARAPGFLHLPDADRRVIFDFTFLWSLFEAQLMASYARSDLIRERVDAWAAAGTLGAELYDTELAYFRARYFVDGELTCHFPYLHLRPADHADCVRSVIEGANNDPRDRVLSLLMIVWRLRNNLFHGEKWAYQIRGQRENFAHANRILMRVLDRHG